LLNLEKDFGLFGNDRDKAKESCTLVRTGGFGEDYQSPDATGRIVQTGRSSVLMQQSSHNNPRSGLFDKPEPTSECIPAQLDFCVGPAIWNTRKWIIGALVIVICAVNVSSNDRT
jgi:hypothetical protein